MNNYVVALYKFANFNGNGLRVVDRKDVRDEPQRVDTATVTTATSTLLTDATRSRDDNSTNSYTALLPGTAYNTLSAIVQVTLRSVSDLDRSRSIRAKRSTFSIKSELLQRI